MILHSARVRELAAAAGFVFASGTGRPALAAPAEFGWDVGVFIGYHFGGAGPRRFAFGVEGRGVYGDLHSLCGKTFYPFGAAVGRLALVGREFRLVTGVQGGFRNFLVGVAGEVGVGYDLRESGGLFVQPGVEAIGAQIFTARAHFAFDRDTSVSVGARFGPGSSPGCVSAGRPLRDCHGLVTTGGAALVASGEEHPAARLWAERAAAEWASVPAFEQLAEQLAACGAPAALVRRALEAADDEARHTVMSAAMAARFAGGPVWLAAPLAGRRPALSGEAGLARLARESWLDGCLAEGAAAASAAAEAASTADRAIARTQTIIAGEEARHAELAWDVLAWAAAASPEHTRATLVACPPIDDAVAARVHSEARARLASLLGANQ